MYTYTYIYNQPPAPSKLHPPTQVEVLRFVRFISALAIATGVLFYAIAVGRGGDPLQMFIACFVVRKVKLIEGGPKKRRPPRPLASSTHTPPHTTHRRHKHPKAPFLKFVPPSPLIRHFVVR